MATTSARTKSNGTNSPGDAAKAAASDYEALKKDVSQLQSDLTSLAGNSGKYIRGKSSEELEKGVEVSKKYATKAGSQLGDATKYVEDKVRKNPLTAVGIAFGTGALLAALRRK